MAQCIILLVCQCVGLIAPYKVYTNYDLTSLVLKYKANKENRDARVLQCSNDSLAVHAQHTVQRLQICAASNTVCNNTMHVARVRTAQHNTNIMAFVVVAVVRCASLLSMRFRRHDANIYMRARCARRLRHVVLTYLYLVAHTLTQVIKNARENRCSHTLAHRWWWSIGGGAVRCFAVREPTTTKSTCGGATQSHSHSLSLLQ